MSKAKQSAPVSARSPRSAALARRLAGGPAWIARNKLLAAVVLGVAVAPVAPILVAYLSRPVVRAEPKRLPTLRSAFTALDKGELSLAAELARDLERPGLLKSNELGGPALIAGLVACRQAEGRSASASRQYLEIAVNDLTRAQMLGFPQGRRAEGTFWLGKCLLLTGRAEESRPILMDALKRNPRKRTEIHGLLAAALMTGRSPRPEAALEHCDRYLADTTLAKAARQAGLLERAGIQFALRDFAACRETLASLARDEHADVEAQLLRGHIQLEEASAPDTQTPPDEANQIGGPAAAEAALSHPTVDPTGSPPDQPARAQPAQDVPVKDKLRAALALLEGARRQAKRDPPLVAAADYLIGRCHVQLGDSLAALAEFRRAAQEWPDSAVSFAAGLEEAELAQAEGRHLEALTMYRRLLEDFDPAMHLAARWMSLEQLRQRLLAGYQQLVAAKHFESAAELAAAASAVWGEIRSTQLVGKAQEQWGRRMLEDAQSIPAPQAAELVQEGRRHLREAGATYRRLARLRTEQREYPDDLFQAAEQLQEGHDFDAAIEAYQEYLDVELRRRRPTVLVRLGRALLARGRTAEALRSFHECVELHPLDAATFEARLLAAAAHREMGEFAEAETLLLQNLEGEALTPASREWRESLFAFGRLLYEAGRYREAVARLEEAVTRYPESPHALETHYLAAEAYRRQAAQVGREIAAELTAEGRLARARQREQLLSAGLDRYAQTIQTLLYGQQPGTASEPVRKSYTPREESILRNCHFSRGTILFELARYEEAIQAYSNVTNRYQQTPEVLDAYVQIAACYRRLGQTAEAKGTLEQAKYALRHLADDVSFESTSNYNREEWTRMLDLLGSL